MLFEMKKAIGIALCIVVACGILAGCTPGTTNTPVSPGAPSAIKVGIVNLEPSESGYREANVKDIARVFTTANGYDAKFSNVPTLDQQINAARQFVTDGVQYLLISAADDTGWDSVLGEAKNAGVKVFLFDRLIECDSGLYEAAVVSDMANQGDTAVAWMKAQKLDEYNVIHIQGQVGSAAQIGRTAALQREIDAGTMNLVSRGTGGDSWSPDEAKRIVEAAIASGLDFNVIYAENDGMAEGAMKALDEAGITYGVNGKVMIMGFDCNRFALRYIMEGKWNYDGQCSPFQADVIDGFIKKLESGGTLSIPADKKVISDEKGFDATGNGAIKVTSDVINQYGLGD